MIYKLINTKMNQNIRLATDNIVIRDNKILLIKRLYEPFKDKWALPEGLVEIGEVVEESCLRELKEETSITGKVEKLVGVYSKPGRDPRGYIVSIAYLVQWVDGDVKAADDAKEYKWFDIDNLPELAFDHKEIVKDALQTKK